MNSLKLVLFLNFEILTSTLSAFLWSTILREGRYYAVKVSKLRNVPEVYMAILVGVVHPEDVPLQLLGVGARVALGHHRVE